MEEGKCINVLRRSGGGTLTGMEVIGNTSFKLFLAFGRQFVVGKSLQLQDSKFKVFNFI